MLFAQDKNVISGKVLDEFGNPIVFAHVSINNSTLGVVSNVKGWYELKNIKSGTYEIKVSSIGFVPKKQIIKLSDGQKKELHFSLKSDLEALNSVVITALSEKSKIERSANAVAVIDTKEAKLKTADLGEVIAQIQGVSVRRSGGLGSKIKFSLNGLTGNQIRFFLDDIPLRFNGYTFGIATVPVNLIDRVEIYKGVVPIQFGADALGGAVNLISPKIIEGFSGTASYQIGSFDSHRTAVYIKSLNKNTGVFFKGGGFYDYSKNNYKVDVEVPDEDGKLSQVTVPRFHDAYKGYGTDFTMGVKNKRWAKEISLKGFYTNYTKEIQHNNLMTGIPYGEVMSYRKSLGTILTYKKNIGQNIALSSNWGYNYSERQFTDTSNCVYNWFGECIFKKTVFGEISSQLVSSNGATNEFTWNNNLFARINLSWELNEQNSIKVTLAPTNVRQTGDNRFVNSYDPLNAHRNLFSWVNGIEYNIEGLEGTLKNSVFIKTYFQKVKSKSFIPPNNKQVLTETKTNNFGYGNGFNYRFTEQFSTKLTYEYATRLPQPDELFGDGQFTLSNLELEPESSHNANLEFSLASKNNFLSSSWLVHTNVFLRKIKNHILFVPSADRTNIYRNVFEATSIGVEIAGNWTAANEQLKFAVNSTYQNFYNNSNEGLFEAFYGDRIPNTPYFFANGVVDYFLKNVFIKNDKLSFFGNTRYVHQFFRSWESAGIASFKKEIPSQQLHNVGVTYNRTVQKIKYALTVEVKNLTNEKNFDFYGVQKPNRAFYIKLITQF